MKKKAASTRKASKTPAFAALAKRAMRRVARNLIKEARASGRPLIVWENGKVVRKFASAFALYKHKVDRTALWKNLNLSHEQRLLKQQDAQRIVENIKRTKRHVSFCKSMKTTDEVFAYAARNGISGARYEW